MVLDSEWLRARDCDSGDRVSDPGVPFRSRILSHPL